MKLTITSNAGLVRQGLENLAGESVTIGRRRMFDMVNRITRRMEEYPPERPGTSRESKHGLLGVVFTKSRRTGLLGRSWMVAKNDDGYTISNNAARKGHRYAVYVVGDARGRKQAWMHVGRWQLFRDVVEQEIEKLPPEVAREFVLVARQRGYDARVV